MGCQVPDGTGCPPRGGEGRPLSESQPNGGGPEERDIHVGCEYRLNGTYPTRMAAERLARAGSGARQGEVNPARRKPGGSLQQAILILLVGILFYEFAVFGVLGTLAASAMSRGDKEAELRFRRLLLRMPGLPVWSPSVKFNSRFRLAAMLMQDRRYAEAAELCRELLRGPRLKPSVEARVRRRLADCLEGLGDLGQSEKERDNASRTLQTAPAEVDVVLARAEEARQSKRYEEAATLYHDALQVLTQPGEARGSALVHLALCYQSLGKPEQMVAAAEEASQMALGAVLLQSALSLAGLGHQSSGRLEEAEARFLSALDVARGTGNPKQVGMRLAQLAGLQKLRGRLREALETCQGAREDMGPDDVRLLLTTEASCHRFLGDFDRALAILDRAFQGGHYGRPDAERRSLAIQSMEAAWILAESRQPDKAWDRLQAADVFRKDKRLGPLWDATAAWILALQGKTEEAQGFYQKGLNAIDSLKSDRRQVQNLYALLGRSALALGAFSDGVTFWQRYIDTRLEPLFVPLGYYHLGLCHQGLGQVEEARQALRTAVDSHVASYHAAAARNALDQIQV